MFNEYLSAQLNDTPLYTSKTKNTNESYRGIYKVDFPDWEGWKVIKMEKKAGVHVSKTYPLFGDEFASWYEVDKIFGKEYRDIIGPENRDPAKVDRHDTKRFSRVGYEVPFGADISEGEKEQAVEYSETFLVNYNKKASKKLDERR